MSSQSVIQVARLQKHSLECARSWGILYTGAFRNILVTCFIQAGDKWVNISKQTNVNI